MYTGTLHHAPFRPDESNMLHHQKREEYSRRLRQGQEGKAPLTEERERKAPETLQELLSLVSPEDSALISLIVFLLCDNTDNDVVLLGILLYVLLSK